jgi:transposase
LRLPSYHPEFNPIEKNWTIIKNWVAAKNTTFKIAERRGLGNTQKMLFFF